MTRSLLSIQTAAEVHAHSRAARARLQRAWERGDRHAADLALSDWCWSGEVAYLTDLLTDLTEWQRAAPPSPPPDGLRTEAEAAAKLTPPPSPRKPRRPGLATQIRRAEKSGREVTSVTLPDGTKLNFGEAEPSEANNPWLADLHKETKQ